jgi:hypothetical protein
VSNIYFNSTLYITYTGSLCTDAATTLNRIEVSSSFTTASFWSEFIVANEDTRSMRLATLIPASSGNTQGWTPNTLANINKVTIADGTFVADATGNILSQWKTQTTAPVGIYAVKSVSIEARLLKSASGPTQFDWSWRISNADYLAGSSNALTNIFANYRLQQDTSPATSAVWGITEVFNTSTNQLNIGVKSLP